MLFFVSRLAPAAFHVSRAEFKHEKFLRAQHHLLPLIKRAEHYEEETRAAPAASGNAEAQGEVVAGLRGEVAGLESKVAEMTGTIEHLSELVDALLLERASGFAPDPSLLPLDIHNAHDALAKKRKHSSWAAASPTAKGVFGGEGPRVAGCENDEAQLLAQMSLEGDNEEPAATAKDTPPEDDFERSFGGFDFSEGALNDQLNSDASLGPLRPITSLTAPSGTSTPPFPTPRGGLSRVASEPSADLWCFLATSLDKLDGMPSEPHHTERAEGRYLNSRTATAHA